MHLDKEEADRFFNIAFSAALLAGRDAVLNQSWEGLKESKLWQDDGADPQKTPQELQERTSVHFDWAKQQCLNEIMLNVTDPRTTSVHKCVCEMVALLLALAQEPGHADGWRETAESGCTAALDLLTMTARPVEPPARPIPNSTNDRLIRASDQNYALSLTASPMIASLRNTDIDTAIRYENRIKDITKVIYKLLHIKDND